MTVSVKSTCNPKLWVLTHIDRYYKTQKPSSLEERFSVSANYEKSIVLIQKSVLALIDEISNELVKCLKDVPKDFVRKENNLDKEIVVLRTNPLKRAEDTYKAALQATKDVSQKAQICVDHMRTLEGYYKKLEEIASAHIAYRKTLVRSASSKGGVVRMPVEKDVYCLDKDTFLKPKLDSVPEEGSDRLLGD